jgi:hypothetical protein
MIRGALTWVLTAAAGLTLLLAGCAAPAFTYVTNSTAHTYFKVPHDWSKIDTGALESVVTGGSATTPPPSVWAVGYDGSTSPTAIDALNSRTARPFVYAVVEPVNRRTTNNLSYNILRNFFLPVTTDARQNAAKVGFRLTNFRLLSDNMIDIGQGIHGIREIYDYTYPDGSTDTFDQVALTNADDTEVYLLLAHCLATCYSQHSSQINTVMTSFTVRSP